MSLTSNVDAALMPAPAAAPLVPQQLGPLAEQAEAALLRQGESANTLRSYRSALRPRRKSRR